MPLQSGDQSLRLLGLVAMALRDGSGGEAGLRDKARCFRVSHAASASHLGRVLPNTATFQAAVVTHIHSPPATQHPRLRRASCFHQKNALPVASLHVAERGCHILRLAAAHSPVAASPNAHHLRRRRFLPIRLVDVEALQPAVWIRNTRPVNAIVGW